MFEFITGINCDSS